MPIGQEGKSEDLEVRGSQRSLYLVFIKRKGKHPLLARKTGDTIKPLFVLVKSVTLPPRPYLRPSLAAARERVLDQFRGRLLKGIFV